MMAGRLVMVLIPVGIIPLRGLVIGTRMFPLGRPIDSHCLSVLAPVVGLVAAKAVPVDD